MDARPADPRSTDERLALEGRDGQALSMAEALAPIPAYSLIARRYRRVAPAARGPPRDGSATDEAGLMGTEIERKFLVRDVSAVKDATGCRTVRAICRPCPSGRSVIRVAGEHAYITIKGTNVGATRAEFEYQIPLADAQALLPMCLPPLDREDAVPDRPRGA